MITLNISTNRQIRTNDGGSIGATAGITVEMVTPATATDAEIQREIRHHYETITGAIRDQLASLASAPATTNGTPKTATPPPAGNGNGKTNGTTAAPTPPAKPNGTTAPVKAPAAPSPAPRPTPPQPAAQRIAADDALARLRAELNAQFDPKTDNDPTPEDDDPDESELPTSGLELLGWARKQPGDAKQELALIGRHKGFPSLIKDWSPGMVAQALQVYARTANH